MAPEYVEVIVVPRSFDRSGSGPITGPIWLCHGARDARPMEFPERDWTDFPLVVLGWWLTELAALRRGTSSVSTCRFMDGPFQITATDTGRTLWRLQCVGNYLDGERSVADFVAPGPAFFESVLAAAHEGIAECERRGWTGHDVDELRRALGLAST